MIVGAGIAGLTAARALHQRGLPCLVLDKSRGVGGRCASRSVDGWPMDHGPPFLHGDDPDFVAALTHLLPNNARLLPLYGGPGALKTTEIGLPPAYAWAPTAGNTALPKALAEALTLRLKVRVTGLAYLAQGGWQVQLEEGPPLHADALILALPWEQAQALLMPWPELCPPPSEQPPASEPCMSLMARYAATPDCPWHLWAPSEGGPLAVIVNDGRKRAAGCPPQLVLHSRAAWAAMQAEVPTEICIQSMLAAACDSLGATWPGQPLQVQLQRWRYATRPANDPEHGPLRRPEAQLALIGDAWGPGRGLQAAWRSGQLLAAAWP